MTPSKCALAATLLVLSSAAAVACDDYADEQAMAAAIAASKTVQAAAVDQQADQQSAAQVQGEPSPTPAQPTQTAANLQTRPQ